MTMTLVKLRYNSKLVPDPGLVLQTPLCNCKSLFGSCVDHSHAEHLPTGRHYKAAKCEYGV